MCFRSLRPYFLSLICTALPSVALAQVPAQPPSSSSASSTKHVKQPATPIASDLDAGAVANGVYRNKTLALSCKIPEGWVLRTEEMNAHDEEKSDSAPAAGASASSGGRVLLAAFSRPPLASAEDINSSIVIAAEKLDTYPGLKEAAQYFGPLTEVTQAQGFTADEDPYEYAIGAKTLVRGDFHKDRGSRKMLQSSLVMLARGYIVSITVIGGTEDEVEELIDGLSFDAAGKAVK